MNEFAALERDVAQLIIEALNLEDMQVDDIDPEAPLFGEGLGLDSIDALEIALALSTQYGIKLRSDDSDNQRIFASLRTLSRYVAEHRTP